MKIITRLLLLAVLTFSSGLMLIGCSTDDQANDSDNENFPSAFGMRGKRNGETFNLSASGGLNDASSFNIFSAYPIEEYVLFQGRNMFEIDLWIHRDHLVPNTTYEVNSDSYLASTHIDMIDLFNDVDEFTLSGFVHISEVDDSHTSGLTVVRGTFEFDTSNTMSGVQGVDYEVREGEFEFILEPQ